MMFSPKILGLNTEILEFSPNSERLGFFSYFGYFLSKSHLNGMGFL